MTDWDKFCDAARNLERPKFGQERRDEIKAKQARALAKARAARIALYKAHPERAKIDRERAKLARNIRALYREGTPDVWSEPESIRPE